jgi:hypothetical protein
LKKAPSTAAATSTAEGKAQKKCGTRPTSSPPAAKKTPLVDLDTSVVTTVISVVHLYAAAPSGNEGAATGGPLLVPWSPKEKDSDDDSDVRVVSSVGDAPHDRSPPDFEHEAPCDEGKSSSASSGSPGSSSENTGQSASPPATATEKDDSNPEAKEEEELVSSNYRVTPEEPQEVIARLQIPPKARLIGGKHIRFLSLMSGGHERKFLEEAGSSFAIPHEEEYFSSFSSEDLATACGGFGVEKLRCLTVPCSEVGIGAAGSQGFIS